MAHFVLHPLSDLHFRGLTRATQLPNRSLQVELARLERLGLITRARDGRLVRYRVQSDNSRWGVLKEMVRQFVEPTEILRVALGQVDDVMAAFVYGSFARRHDVHANSDIDLFVVSRTLHEEPTQLSISAAVLEVSGFLRREVNPVRYTPSQLAQKLARKSRFVTSVLAGEKAWLLGDEARLRAALGQATHGKARVMSA